jgi:hypothetical protein
MFDPLSSVTEIMDIHRVFILIHFEMKFIAKGLFQIGFIRARN